MPGAIKRDHSRFKQIVRGNIRKNLKRYITQGELIGKSGGDVVKVPLPQIETPRFRFGAQEQGGVGQGEGQEGDPVSGQDQQGQPGEGNQEAGDQPGEHAIEADVTLEELAEILGEELQLPRIEPRGASTVTTTVPVYRGIRRIGPESLRHFKRTYREALKRQVSSGTYNQDNPVIVPIKDDMRYRSYKQVPLPQYNALIIYIMDVSGSMGEEQKEIVRLESFWLDTWIKYNYQGVDTRYIIHDAKAREVDEDTFYRTRESGGTLISSAYEEAIRILTEEYSLSEWNVYIFQFSDGDNWSTDDTRHCVDMLRDTILPMSNLFGYGQVKSFFGSGQYITDLRSAFEGEENLVLSEIPDKDSILSSIRDLLGTGK